MKTTLRKLFGTALSPEMLVKGLVGLGIVLYLRQYLFNRSLWLDECMLAVNLMDCSILQMLCQPLPKYLQAAPFMFCAIEKLAISIGGASEYVLRLYPLVCGICSLWLFAKTAPLFLSRWLAVLAMAIFVCTPELAYFASEVKPYGGDVAATLIVLFVVGHAAPDDLDWRSVLGLALLGVGMVWLSFPSVFVLAGVGGTRLVEAWIRRWRSASIRWSLVASAWSASFVAYFIVSLRNVAHVQGPIPYWNAGYVGFAAGQTPWAIWVRMLRNPMHFTTTAGLVTALFLIGVCAFWREDKRKLFVLAGPILLVFAASALRLYSCMDRMMLFLAPLFILLVVRGIQRTADKPLAAVLLFAFACGASLTTTWQRWCRPLEREEIRTVLAHVQPQVQPGDVLYVYPRATPHFAYYGARFGMEMLPMISGRSWTNNQACFAEDVMPLFGHRRAWLLFAHIDRTAGRTDDAFCKDYLQRAGGRLLSEHRAPQACAYLFDLSKVDSAHPAD